MMGYRFWIILGTLFKVINVSAWSISPPSLSVSESKPTGYFTIESSAKESDTPIEISAAIRYIDENGVDRYEKNAEDLFVFPKQVILKPGKNQMIRVMWKGKGKLTQEKAFRVIVEQQPVELASSPKEEKEENTVAIRMGTQYVCSFYVEPKRAQPKVEVTQFHHDPSTNKVSILLENKGNAHQVFLPKELHLLLKDAKESVEIPADLLERAGVRVVNLLAGNKRKLEVSLDERCPKRIVAVELKQ